MKECPFCGAVQDTDPCSAFIFTCRTQASGGTANIVYLRSHICYKRQITQQAELLGRALEVVRGVYLTPSWDGRGDCCFCGRPYGHDTDCTRMAARSLIPDLEKALEKVK